MIFQKKAKVNWQKIAPIAAITGFVAAMGLAIFEIDIADRTPENVSEAVRVTDDSGTTYEIFNSDTVLFGDEGMSFLYNLKGGFVLINAESAYDEYRGSISIADLQNADSSLANIREGGCRAALKGASELANYSSGTLILNGRPKEVIEKEKQVRNFLANYCTLPVPH